MPLNEEFMVGYSTNDRFLIDNIRYTAEAVTAQPEHPVVSAHSKIFVRTQQDRRTNGGSKILQI